MVPIDLQAEEVVQPADRSIPAAAGHGTGDAAAAAVQISRSRNKLPFLLLLHTYNS